MKKVIVVFANSVKHGLHCVAGKDAGTGEWIRPVADANGKELDNKHGEYMVKPLQKVEIELVKYAPLSNQPENWIVGPAQWAQRFKIEPHEIEGYLDEPETLWGTEWKSQKGTADRVPYSEIESGSIEITQSLYLVRVRDLKLNKYMNAWNKTERRASFSYNGSPYDLAITDPNLDRHLEAPQHQNILCVSLGEEYEGYCYKIVAAII
uniref:Dual OB-containing domain-containing protein n=1 Tax=Candidatus Kentrum sp. TC TaxID=2126339 RepID=A0A450YX61_9GAMM|nr:MAG: hypothetical protein BECKTC1821D_GA0114238_102824 [Candidatus Kentron sp. TC]